MFTIFSSSLLASPFAPFQISRIIFFRNPIFSTFSSSRLIWNGFIVMGRSSVYEIYFPPKYSQSPSYEFPVSTITISVSCSYSCRTTEFMWNDFPDPEGPKQKKFELSVIFTFPSFPEKSIATGTPCRSV